MSSERNARPKVLFVDDALSMRKTAEQVLGESYRVLTASDGQEALDVLRVHGDIQALISDLTMPNCDGRELLRALRSSSDDYLSRMPVIIVTGTRSGGMASKLTRAGAHGVMTKPYKPEALLRRTQQLLEFSNRTRPSHRARPQAVLGPAEPSPAESPDTLFRANVATDQTTPAPTDVESQTPDQLATAIEAPESDADVSLEHVEPAQPDPATASTAPEAIEDAANLLPGMETNASGLQDRLCQAVALHVRHDLPMVVVKLELLNMAEVCPDSSDTARVHAFVLRRLCEALREEDSAGPYADDTFLLVLPMTTESGGVVVLNRLQEVLEAESFLPDVALEIRATLCHSDLAQFDLDALDAVGRRFAETDQAFESVTISTPVAAEAA